MTSPDEVNEQESVSHEIAIVSLDEGEVDPGQAVGETDKASKICRQIEHYFSDANLPTDEYLLTRIRRNKQGWVPLSCILKFNKMKKLCKGDVAVAAEALRVGSVALEVNATGTAVRRVAPLPPHDPFEIGTRTVLVENLPSESTAVALQELFSVAGAVRVARLCQPSTTASTLHAAAAHDPWCTLNVVCTQQHALVEFSTREEAQRAVEKLNDGTNWRTGLRVRLVRRDVAKHKASQDGDDDGDGQEVQADDQQQHAPSAEAGATQKEREHKGKPAKKDYAAWASVAAHKQAKEAGGNAAADEQQRTAPRRFFAPRTAPVSGLLPPTAAAPGSSGGVREAAMPDGTRGFGLGRGAHRVAYGVRHETEPAQTDS